MSVFMKTSPMIRRQILAQLQPRMKSAIDHFQSVIPHDLTPEFRDPAAEDRYRRHEASRRFLCWLIWSAAWLSLGLGLGVLISG